MLEEYLLRYGWPWFPVVDADGRFVGLVTREAAEAVPEADRAEKTVDEVMAPDPEGSMRVPMDQPIEALLQTSRDGLARLGALMAVDAEGRAARRRDPPAAPPRHSAAGLIHPPGSRTGFRKINSALPRPTGHGLLLTLTR